MNSDGDTEYAEIARAEGARGEVVLRERRPADGPVALELRVNGVFVMDTLEVGSEQALATAALRASPDPTNVLIGGLGLGFTLDALLVDSRVERVVVVELEQTLVDWMRDGTVPHGPRLLADRRVTVAVADIARALTEAREASYDLVLLDVDNGPGHLVHDANAALYEPAFLALVARVLRPGGILVVWSADESPELASTLRQSLGDVRAERHDVILQGRAETYWLYSGSATAAGTVDP